MKKILIDVDDVICDNGFTDMLNSFLGTNYKAEDFTTYYIEEEVIKAVSSNMLSRFIYGATGDGNIPEEVKSKIEMEVEKTVEKISAEKGDVSEEEVK